jgi:hypothetical protein
MAGLTLEAAHALERDFLGRWPDYQAWLEEDRVRALLAPRLAAARRIESPFPHVFVEDLLPKELYEMLRDAWPPNDALRLTRNRQKLDLVPRDDASYEYSAGFATLPECIRGVWRFYVYVVGRRIVGPWVGRVFEAEIAERVEFLQRLAREGRLGFQASGLASGHYEANSGRLMMRGMGYTLAPHVDPASYLVTLLHYFASEDDADCGTVLYKAERPVPVEAFVADGTTEYFHSHGIAAREAARMPFIGNALLAFPNLLDAAHGVVAPPDGYRKVFQYHLSLKGDHEPL